MKMWLLVCGLLECKCGFWFVVCWSEDAGSGLQFVRVKTWVVC